MERDRSDSETNIKPNNRMDNLCFQAARWRDWLSRRLDLFVLLAVLSLAAGAWFFLEVADAVVEGKTQTLDERILLALRETGNLSEPIGPPTLHEYMRDFTALGGVAVLLTVTLAAAGYLWFSGKTHALLLLLTSTSGGWALMVGLKHWFDRPRPSVVPHLMLAKSSSFPSGHAVLSAVVYLTLGAILARMAKTTALKLYIICVSLAVSAIVGVSRVFLGVHYPSDVLAGWVFGLSWATLCWLSARILQHQGWIETADEGGEPGSPRST